MTVTYMLDTNMVSYIVRGRSRAASARLLKLNPDEMACVSAVTDGEIKYGLAKRPEASTLKMLLDGFLCSIQVLPWGRDEAEAYGQARATLEKGGMSLGHMDLMIAAHAIATGAVLVSYDKAFSHVANVPATLNCATDL